MKATHIKIVSKSHKYIVQGMTVCDLLLKIIIQKFTTDMGETSYHLRENLTNLYAYMTTEYRNVNI